MSQKILIVDDDPDNVSFLSLIFEDHGYSTVSANDGNEGLEMAKKEGPDLITLDLIMPGQSGIMMFQDLKKDPDLCEIPVVIISGASEVTGVDFKNFILKQSFREEKQSVETSGSAKFSAPNAFVEKPVDATELMKIIRDILKD